MNSRPPAIKLLSSGCYVIWVSQGAGSLIAIETRTKLSSDQKAISSVNRKPRPSFSVLVICPKLFSLTLMPGSANCG